MPLRPATVSLNSRTTIDFQGDARLEDAIHAANKHGIGVKDNGKLMKLITDGFNGSQYAASERPFVRALWRAAARDANFKFGGLDTVHGNTKIRVGDTEVKFASSTAARDFVARMAQWWGGLSSGEKTQVTGNDAEGKKEKKQIDTLMDKVNAAIDNVVAIINESKAVHPKYDSARRGWVEGASGTSVQQTLDRNRDVLSKGSRDAIDQTFRTILGRRNRGRVDEYRQRWGIIPLGANDLRYLDRTLTGFFTDDNGDMQSRLGKTAQAILDNVEELSSVDVAKDITGQRELASTAKVVMDKIWQSRTGRVDYDTIRERFANEPAAVRNFAFKLFGWARHKFAGRRYNPETREFERMPRGSMCTDEKGKVYAGLMGLKKGGELYNAMVKASNALARQQS